MLQKRNLYSLAVLCWIHLSSVAARESQSVEIQDKLEVAVPRGMQLAIFQGA